MKTKIKNLTKHQVSMISLNDVMPKGRHSDKFLLKGGMESFKPILTVDPLIALNVYETKGVGTEFYIDGICFQAAPYYTQNIDGFNGIGFDEDCLFIVSKKYSEAAKDKFQFHPHILDRLFIPAGLVEKDGNIIGCTRLQKVSQFQSPSFYLSVSADFATKQMAIAYWRINWTKLSPSELEALKILSSLVGF